MNTYNFEFYQGGQWNLIRVRAESLTDAERQVQHLKLVRFVSWGY